MSKLKHISRAGWVLIGVVAALVLAPTVAYATLSYTGIQGTSSNKADVSPAKQLLTTQADASQTVMAFGSPGCPDSSFYTVPTGHALIITTINYYHVAASVDSPQQLYLFDGIAGCSTELALGLAPTGTDEISQTQTFQPGIPVPAGDKLGVIGSNSNGSLEIFGYLVPSAAVPASVSTNLPRLRDALPSTRR